MKINLSNYEIDTKDLTALFPPSKYIIPQKKAGCSVINLYSALSGVPYERYIKAFWAILYNSKYIIIYDDPETTDNSLVKKAVNFAFKNSITVFYRKRSNCISGFTPEYEELTKQINRYHSLPGNNYQYIGSNYLTVEEQPKFKKLQDKTKNKLRKYIKYYDMPYPETEYEWYLIKKQLVYYLQNKIQPAYDRNLYYICPECKELIRRGTEEEHICYCEIAPQMTHMDYILNGEE